jgi:clathrin heavy chain
MSIFKQAQICGLNIIVHAVRVQSSHSLIRESLRHPCYLQEELPGILKLYEYDGHFDEVISLLEAGLSLERAHVSFRRRRM